MTFIAQPEAGYLRFFFPEYFRDNVNVLSWVKPTMSVRLLLDFRLVASWVFLLQRQTPCEQVRSWGLEIVSGSFSWVHKAAPALVLRDVVCTSLDTDAVLSSILTFLAVLLVNLFLSHFLWSLAWNEWAGSRKALHEEPRQGALSAITPTGQRGKGETLGDWMSPAFPAVSRFRSLIPKAQSRYSLTERCPAEKDLSFSS